MCVCLCTTMHTCVAGKCVVDFCTFCSKLTSQSILLPLSTLDLNPSPSLPTYPQTINLECNQIHDDGCFHIAGALLKNPENKLHSLYLGVCPPSHPGSGPVYHSAQMSPMPLLTSQLPDSHSATHVDSYLHTHARTHARSLARMHIDKHVYQQRRTHAQPPTHPHARPFDRLALVRC